MRAGCSQSLSGLYDRGKASTRSSAKLSKSTVLKPSKSSPPTRQSMPPSAAVVTRLRRDEHSWIGPRALRRLKGQPSRRRSPPKRSPPRRRRQRQQRQPQKRQRERPCDHDRSATMNRKLCFLTHKCSQAGHCGLINKGFECESITTGPVFGSCFCPFGRQQLSQSASGRTNESTSAVP